jgi:hypothetical protein
MNPYPPVSGSNRISEHGIRSKREASRSADKMGLSCIVSRICPLVIGARDTGHPGGGETKVSHPSVLALTFEAILLKP